MAYYTYTNAPVHRSSCFVDGRPTNNQLAVSCSLGNGTAINGSTATVVAGQQYTARVDTYHNPIAERFAFNYADSVLLDTTVDESGANGYVPESSITPNQLGFVGQGGCQAFWLENGSLVAIYRTRSTVGGAWSYWWRINNQSGRTDLTLSGGLYLQPPISSAGIGNWGPRVSISPASTDWIQIARGQGKIVALYNTGTMLGNTVSVLHTNDAYQYTRTAGTLYLIYALDSLCQTWSAPVQVATGAAPHFGGLAYTGEAWVACYTRNSDLSPRVLRSKRLDDWSAAVDTPMYASDGVSLFQTPDMNAPAQNGNPSPMGISGTSVMPPRPVHCLSLIYGENHLLNGVWVHYADTPDTYTAGIYNQTTGALTGTYSVLQSYGTFGGIKSGNQGRTWFCPPALHSYSDCVTIGPGLNSGFPGARSFQGCATLVDGYTWLNATSYPPVPGGMSYLGWYESIS